jgi:adenosyl cobinamide kinase/adenosyl cobinamide phosphate guanylyltransferase
VDGHCGCPSPREWHHGFAVGLYHVDTQEALNALADTIRRVHQRSMDKTTVTSNEISPEVVYDKELRRDLDEILQRLKARVDSPERAQARVRLSEAIMWLGMDLKARGLPDPYPESRDPSSPVVRPPADGVKL